MHAKRNKWQTICIDKTPTDNIISFIIPNNEMNCESRDKPLGIDFSHFVSDY